MRRYLLILLFSSLFLTAQACSSKEDRAAELYSIAEFEEQQFNVEHATELYQEILEKYPDTSWAERATKRLDGLR